MNFCRRYPGRVAAPSGLEAPGPLTLIQRLFHAGVSMAFGFGCASASGQDLVSLVDSALASEPSLMSARSELSAAQARYDQSVGGLLPQVRASANTAYNGRNYTTLPQPEDPRAVDPGTEDEQKAPSRGRAQAETERGRYNASGAEISLTLPVFRPAAIIEKRQSATVVLQATSELEATKQELMHRVVDAWLEVLSARLELGVTQEKELVARQQMKLVKMGSVLGAYSLPEQEEALSRYHAAQVELRAADSQHRLKQLALEHLVGGAVRVPALVPPTSLDEAVKPLMARWFQEVEFPLEALEKELMQRNPSVQAANLALQSAGQSVQRSQAGHLPTLDFTATASRTAQGLGTSAGQAGFRSKLGSVALELRIPIYSGGVDAARVREAVARLEAAEHALEGARRKAISELHQAWYAAAVARARMDAGDQALRAAEVLVHQAERGLSQGMKSELDLLQARVQRQTAQRDRQSALSDLIRSAVRIKALLASMDMDGVAAIDRLWAESPSEWRDLSAKF